MSYFDFLRYIDKEQINIIFEFVSRDLVDSIKIIGLLQ